MAAPTAEHLTAAFVCPGEYIKYLQRTSEAPGYADLAKASLLDDAVKAKLAAAFDGHKQNGVYKAADLSYREMLQVFTAHQRETLKLPEPSAAPGTAVVPPLDATRFGRRWIRSQPGLTLVQSGFTSSLTRDPPGIIDVEGIRGKPSIRVGDLVFECLDDTSAASYYWLQTIGADGILWYIDARQVGEAAPGTYRRMTALIYNLIASIQTPGKTTVLANLLKLRLIYLRPVSFGCFGITRTAFNSADTTLINLLALRCAVRNQYFALKADESLKKKTVLLLDLLNITTPPFAFETGVFAPFTPLMCEEAHRSMELASQMAAADHEQHEWVAFSIFQMPTIDSPTPSFRRPHLIQSPTEDGTPLLQSTIPVPATLFDDSPTKLRPIDSPLDEASQRYAKEVENCEEMAKRYAEDRRKQEEAARRARKQEEHDKAKLEQTRQQMIADQKRLKREREQAAADARAQAAAVAEALKPQFDSLNARMDAFDAVQKSLAQQVKEISAKAARDSSSESSSDSSDDPKDSGRASTGKSTGTSGTRRTPKQSEAKKKGGGRDRVPKTLERKSFPAHGGDQAEYSDGEETYNPDEEEYDSQASETQSEYEQRPAKSGSRRKRSPKPSARKRTHSGGGRRSRSPERGGSKRSRPTTTPPKARRFAYMSNWHQYLRLVDQFVAPDLREEFLRHASLSFRTFVQDYQRRNLSKGSKGKAETKKPFKGLRARCITCGHERDNACAHIRENLPQNPDNDHPFANSKHFYQGLFVFREPGQKRVSERRATAFHGVIERVKAAREEHPQPFRPGSREVWKRVQLETPGLSSRNKMDDPSPTGSEEDDEEDAEGNRRTPKGDDVPKKDRGGDRRDDGAGGGGSGYVRGGGHAGGDTHTDTEQPSYGGGSGHTSAAEGMKTPLHLPMTCGYYDSFDRSRRMSSGSGWSDAF